ncbi:hypothetical protein BRD07_05245, partial [Halobacteriales archaeon QS_9_68_42]
GGLGAVLVVAQLVVARQAFGDAGQMAILGLSGVALGLTAAAVRRTRNIETADERVAPVGG